MTTPSVNDFHLYQGKQITNGDWDFNWSQLITYLTDGNMDFNINSITSNTFSASNWVVTGGSIDGVTIGTNDPVTELQVDNININGNTISSTSGDIDVNPTGRMNITENIDSANIPFYGCRAWVNFSGTTSDNESGTYSQTGNTLIVTLTSCDYVIGNKVYLDFTSGAATDGLFEIIAVTDTTFTISHTLSQTTSGNVTINRRLIAAAENVNSVIFSGDGIYYINMTKVMPDTSYSIAGSCGNGGGDSAVFCIGSNLSTVDISEESFKVIALNCGASETSLINPEYVNVQVFR